jgi:hypothetical protein
LVVVDPHLVLTFVLTLRFPVHVVGEAPPTSSKLKNKSRPRIGNMTLKRSKPSICKVSARIVPKARCGWNVRDLGEKRVLCAL